MHNIATNFSQSLWMYQHYELIKSDRLLDLLQGDQMRIKESAKYTLTYVYSSEVDHLVQGIATSQTRERQAGRTTYRGRTRYLKKRG
jgi:hypothetical protein